MNVIHIDVDVGIAEPHPRIKKKGNERLRSQAGENVGGLWRSMDDVREVRRTIESRGTEKNRKESHRIWDCTAHVSTTVNIFTDLRRSSNIPRL